VLNINYIILSNFEKPRRRYESTINSYSYPY